ncbi:CAP domain-containing protein [Massilia sp. PAMC28688]|uniref:CAP domain-containing protein n=1 Tax=Massilia sp. PAMC28688 TaxID=2861283 RepID=UPI001C62AACB|nr:CAP domain-containing protein [Massilia sp. PAMC28688]QYF94661.1 CAP domain-containing protein [Massilia sp. PAMC28688]
MNKGASLGKNCFRRAGSRAILALAGACAAAAARPAPATELVSLLNQFRASPASCGSQPMPAVGTLSPHPALAAVHIGSGTLLTHALERQGYAAEHVEAMFVTGPQDAGAVMEALVRAYCPAIRSERFSAVGVSRTGNAWQVVLAQPAPPRPPPVVLPPLSETGAATVEAVNRARASARTCGSTRFAPAPPVALSPQLADAAMAHSRDMAAQNYFSHRGKNGSDVGRRAAAVGYAWRDIGENIAYGQRSVEEVMTGWLASPGHCANIMQARFTQVGMGYAVEPQSGRVYWTQVLGTPR